jgi:4-hydroxybenzoate polyprenyltransferase
VRGMSTIPILFDIPRTTIWILGCTIIHVMMAFLFMTRLGLPARIGIIAGLCLLIIANIVILKNKTSDAALRVLPLFHVAMILYAGGIVAAALW